MNRLRPYLTPRAIIGVIVALLVVALGVFLAPLALAAPTVLSVTPSDGATAANPQGAIRVVFSQWVRPSSIAAAVKLDPPVEFTVVADSFPRPGAAVVLIQPKGGLRYGTPYRLTLANDLSNLVGRRLDQPLAIAFTTAPYVTVARFGPGQGATNTPLNAPITVEFASPVVSAELVAAAAEDPRRADQLPQPLALTPAAPGLGRWLSPTLFGYYPNDELHAATTYTATLGVDLTPDGSARLEQPIAWSFATESLLFAGARPFDGATEVSATGDVEVRLASDVDVASAGAHFSLANAESGVVVAGNIQPGSGGFRFKPAAPLDRGARYEARLASGISTTTGAPLNADPLTWQFTVIGDLAVEQVEPLADAIEVLTDTHRISVRFNHPVVALTTIDAQASQPQPLTITPALPGVGRWLDTSTYVYSPTAGLAPSTDYRVRVAAGLRDQTGGTLAQEYAWGFSTIKPFVLNSQPALNDSYASPRDPIRISFNQPMDLASLRAAITLRRSDTGEAVAGTLTSAGSTASFAPATELERNASYVLSIAAGARSAQGDGALANPFELPFQVAPLPQLLSSDPADGSTAANLNGSVTLNFSTPMDWDAVWENLTIEPKPTEVYSSSNQAQFYLYFPQKPDSDYRVTVGAAAHDPYGVTLGQDAAIGFHTGSLPPSFSLVGPYQIGSYNAYVNARVPLRYVNTPTLSYSLYRLDPQEVPRLLSDYQAWQSVAPDSATLVKQEDVNLEGERNQDQIKVLDMGRLEAGLYLLKLRGPGDLADQQIMSVSPYALTIKRSAGQLFIWAVDLATGKPTPDLALQGLAMDSSNLTGGAEPRALGSTDGEGIFQTAFSSAEVYAPLFVWSSVAGRFAFATSNWGEGINPWDFGLPSNPNRSPVVGNLSTDRPIYRPEQLVYVRGVLRMSQDERYRLPDAGQRVHLTINDAKGSVVLSTTLPLSEFGSFNTSLRLERSAALGNYSMYSRLEGDSENNSTYGSFIVAEYRKPAFELTVTPSAPDLVQGQPLQMNVSARYFFGGAVANAPVRWRLLANPLYFAPESAPNFRFEDLDDAYASYRWYDSDRGSGGGELVSDGTAKTDAQGNFSLSLPADLGKENHSRTLTLSVEVTDVDGQVIAGEGTTNVHLGAFYIGLRPEGYVAQVGQPQAISLITVAPDGKPVGARALDVGTYKREWYSVREQGADGQFYFTSQYTDTLVLTQTVTTDAQGRGSISITPKEAGSYRILAAGRDDAGHVVKSSAYTWVFGGEAFWGVNDTNRVDLIADKDRYKPGDTASILVPAPYAGMTALMTIERGSVIEHKLLTIAATTELLHIPITADYAPNVYVSVVLVKPAGGDLPTPDLRVGLVNLPVSTEQQELAISVTPDKQTAGPRDQVTYTVKATDYTGKGVRAEVALALVDKAVLSLADDPNPTLTQAFYEKQPLGVLTAQSLTALVDRVTLKLQPGNKGGGGGGEADVLVRSNFPDTAYWNPALVTGDDGTGTVTLTLPDNLTTWRMSARGLTADTRVGQATQELVATRPLLVRPTLPRFLTVGDALTISAVVHNTTANAISAQVKLDASGLTLGGPAQQAVQVPANGEVVVDWPATVPAPQADAPMQAKLHFDVSGGGLQDIVEQVLPIQRFTTPEVVASAGQVQDTTVETIAAPANAPQATSGLTTTQGELDLELTPSLAAGVGSGLDYLANYPYDCTEQTVSRFLPNAVTYRLFKQLGADDQQLKASLESNLATGLQRLYSMQHLDGGWGWWANDDSQPYLTAYVVQGLLEARKAGYGVDQKVLDGGIAFVEAALDRDTDADTLLGGNTRSYLLFVLSEAGRADRGRTVALFEQRAQLTIYSRAYLLMTFKTLGGEDARVRTLVSELMSSALLHTTGAHWEERTNDYWTLSSDTRTTALALQALVRADPNNFLVPNATRYLMGLRDGGHWRTTQETAMSLVALSEYVAQSGELDASYSYRAVLDGRTLREGAVSRDNLNDPISVVVALADLKLGDKSQLTIQRQAGAGQTGKGRLYYTIRMRTYQDAAAVQPLDQGLGITRDYIAVDSATLTPTGQLISQAKVGDVVQVQLTLTVPEDVHYLAVEDMLAAGLEALDTSLKTVSSAAVDPGLADASDQRADWRFFTQTEIHDNRVALFATDLPKGTYHYTYLARATIAGTFQTLPATAYQMYTPDVFGRSAGVRFVVVR